ncbi:ABC transporter ATP-binding protein [Nakamurella sp.]|uniref:ABC transporter ATP-binding protein n=1 Tax=Nakamurella sp. TaxID=1869182 RepID=UPI0037833E98
MSDDYLRLRGVSKTFATPAGPLPVLDRIDTAIGRGEFVAVIGPSGCGKSTLFNVLSGLEPPTGGGRVELAGADITGTVGHCAYMPQRDLLMPWRSILDNTVLGLDVQGVPRAAGRRRAAALFEQFGLAGFENAYPAELSGGMRQRAALLRTVVQDREIVALDEPFGALDSLTRTDLQGWLQGVWRRHDWTVLMITHDIREAIYLADRVLVLSPRPARIIRDLAVPLPRPREVRLLTAPEFVALEAELLDLLHSPARR